MKVSILTGLVLSISLMTPSQADAKRCKRCEVANATQQQAPSQPMAPNLGAFYDRHGFKFRCMYQLNADGSIVLNSNGQYSCESVEPIYGSNGRQIKDRKRAGQAFLRYKRLAPPPALQTSRNSQNKAQSSRATQPTRVTQQSPQAPQHYYDQNGNEIQIDRSPAPVRSAGSEIRPEVISSQKPYNATQTERFIRENGNLRIPHSDKGITKNDKDHIFRVGKKEIYEKLITKLKASHIPFVVEYANTKCTMCDNVFNKLNTDAVKNKGIVVIKLQGAESGWINKAFSDARKIHGSAMLANSGSNMPGLTFTNTQGIEIPLDGYPGSSVITDAAIASALNPGFSTEHIAQAPSTSAGTAENNGSVDLPAVTELPSVPTVPKPASVPAQPATEHANSNENCLDGRCNIPGEVGLEVQEYIEIDSKPADLNAHAAGAVNFPIEELLEAADAKKEKDLALAKNHEILIQSDDILKELFSENTGSYSLSYLRNAKLFLASQNTHSDAEHSLYLFLDKVSDEFTNQDEEDKSMEAYRSEENRQKFIKIYSELFGKDKLENGLAVFMDESEVNKRITQMDQPEVKDPVENEAEAKELLAKLGDFISKNLVSLAGALGFTANDENILAADQSDKTVSATSLLEVNRAPSVDQDAETQAEIALDRLDHRGSTIQMNDR